MVIVMSPKATEEQTQRVIDLLVRRGFDAHRSTGATRTVIGAVGGGAESLNPADFEILEGVHEVVKISEPYKLAGRVFRQEDTVIELGDVKLGGPRVVLIAGPCAVESAEQIDTIAASVKRAGAAILRGGAFKPRSSPYSFQGLGEQGLRLLRDAGERHGLKVVSEVMDPSQIPVVSEYAHILQVGARNMQNFHFLKELGKVRRPVLLKRGMSATIQELLLSAEYILSGGNSQVILCERGIRTFENYTRNTMDISAIPVLKSLSHLPVIGDPSHGTGRRDKVIPMARAAVAAGADGLMIEVHHDPDNAASDGAQSLFPEQFAELVGQLRVIAPVVGRSL